MSLRNIENGNAFANNILFPILERSCYDGSNKLTFRVAIKGWYFMVIMLKSRVDVLVGAYFSPCFFNLIKSKATHVILKSIMVCSVMQEWVHKTNSWGEVVFYGEGMFCGQSSWVWVNNNIGQSFFQRGPNVSWSRLFKLAIVAFQHDDMNKMPITNQGCKPNIML